MSNGGVKFHEMHTAHRYREINCQGCGNGFLAYGQRKLCDGCKAAKTKTPEAQVKAAAQRAVTRAIASGELIRKPCVICAAFGAFDPRSHGHHEDYSKPLDVIWLCSWHHINRHDHIRAMRAKSLPCPPATAEELVAERIRSAKEVRSQNPAWKFEPAPWDENYVPPDYETRPVAAAKMRT
jgi:hypothetical protein